jgi:hypothetical protein
MRLNCALEPIQCLCNGENCAVYGDNFFKRSQYTIQASILSDASMKTSLEKTEREIMEKRAQLLSFEKEFKRTRQEFEAVRHHASSSSF